MEEDITSIQIGDYTKFKDHEGHWILIYKGEIVMTDHPIEFEDFEEFYQMASGNILISGLGLHVMSDKLLGKDGVEQVTILEKSQEVIALSDRWYDDDPRVTVIQADVFTWDPPEDAHYDYVWHDIWNTVTCGNVDEMDTLIAKYASFADTQVGWREQDARDRKEGKPNALPCNGETDIEKLEIK